MSFSVSEGEILGIVGPNGAGKSTILKLIAHILEPNGGTVMVRQKVSALLELGAGFHSEFTGRENIQLFGSFHGLGRREIRRRMDEIVQFSELENFIDQPVKAYSSGMYVRLAFSVAFALDPQILLIDEALTVGDEHFQRKCKERIGELWHSGRTIVVVSHDLRQLRGLCPRLLWIQNGACLADGSSDQVLAAYLEAVEAAEPAKARIQTSTAHPANALA